jgi:hypothetical protein
MIFLSFWYDGLYAMFTLLAMWQFPFDLREGALSVNVHKGSMEESQGNYHLLYFLFIKTWSHKRDFRHQSEGMHLLQQGTSIIAWDVSIPGQIQGTVQWSSRKTRNSLYIQARTHSHTNSDVGGPFGIASKALSATFPRTFGWCLQILFCVQFSGI